MPKLFFYKQILACAGIILLLSSCNYFRRNNTKEEVAVARVFDAFLYHSDLKEVIPAGIPPRDSIKIARNYIEEWIRQQVVLKKAEDNLDKDKVDVEKQLRDYRNSLITFEYKKELTEQRLDTVVGDGEINSYYEKHKGDFELKFNIVKVLYLKLEKHSPHLDKVKRWYKSELPKDRQSLEDYSRQYALNFFLDDNTWLLFDDILKEVPIKTYDQEQFLKNNRFIEIEDSVNVYLVNIKGFRIKDSVSPLSFEKENIRNYILNQRKLDLIEEMEKKAYEDALKNHDFEIFVR